jgi:hypothetical protein
MWQAVGATIKPREVSLTERPVERKRGRRRGGQAEPRQNQEPFHEASPQSVWMTSISS